MTNIIRLSGKKKLSIPVQTAATVFAIVCAVALPQVFHWIGTVSGAGKAPGVAFSPMHLPIIAAGLLAGPYVGAIAGLLGPVAAHFLSGMPTAAQLPFMMMELFGYGLAAGLLRFVKMLAVVKVLISLVFGRVVRMAAVFVAVQFFGSNLPVLGIWKSVPKTLPGIILQIILIPMFVYWVETRAKNEK